MRRRRCFAGCVVAGWLVAGCGGGKSDDPGSPSSSPTTSGTDAAIVDTIDSGGQSGTTGGAVDVAIGEAPQDLAIPLTVTLAGSGPVWAACTRADDADEVLLAESDAAVARHDLVVLGGAAGATYDCVVHGPSGGIGERSVTLPELPGPKGYTVTVEAAQAVDPFLTLFADLRACADEDDADTHIVMVDHRGEARWLLEVPEPLASIDLDVRQLDDGTIHFAGGWGTSNESLSHRGIFRTVDLAGGVRVDRPTIGFGLGFNHHSEQLADGTIATLSFDELVDGSAEMLGVAIEWWDPAADQVVRTWTSQQLVDEGLRFDDTDHLGIWTANSLELADDPLGQGLYLSVVTADEVWRLDPVTGSLTHRIGPHADWTLVDEAGTLLEERDWFFFQHDPEITPDGRMLLHDNGTTRGLVTTSRILELQLDYAAKQATVIWEWTEPGWGNRYVGDVDRLDDGSVAIAQGYFSCLSGPLGRSAVVQVDPATDDVVWRLDWNDAAFAPYRSERLDLCATLPNTRDCPALAERLAVLEAQ